MLRYNCRTLHVLTAVVVALLAGAAAAVAVALIYSVKIEALLRFRKGITTIPLGALSTLTVGHAHAQSVHSSSSVACARSAVASKGPD
jgi:hypothetical protein